MPRRVAVIGAGICGLVSIKSCLEEGLEPTCFEMSGDIGGLWRYHETPEDGRASAMWSTIYNSSKEMSSPSDFLLPTTAPLYPHHTTILKFVESYADHFSLRPYIRVNRKVCWIAPKEGQKWEVTTCETNKEKSVEETETFDAVIVCTGIHALPLYPETPGLREKFQGQLLHSHAYRHPRGFENSLILVVGCGDSACDIATELCTLCPKVYLSVRRGAWVVPRVGPFGIAIDMFFLTRVFNWLFNLLPYRLWVFFPERIANFYVNHDLYQLKPPHRMFDQAPTLNDSLPSRIASGKIIVKGHVREYTEKGVIFDGETEVTPVDVAILATGYRMEFPFLPKDIVPAPNNKNSCYKFTFPPEHPSLAFVGLCQPLGPVVPLGELQSRWVAAVLSGRCRLPPEQEMRETTQRDLKCRAKRFSTSPAHASHLDYINTMDDFATLLGVKPSMWRMLLTDPRLFYRCMFGPCTGFQYRLQGPHLWPGARDAILSTDDRIKAAFQTRHSHPRHPSSSTWSSLLKLPFMAFLLFLISLFIFMVFKLGE